MRIHANRRIQIIIAFLLSGGFWPLGIEAQTSVNHEDGERKREENNTVVAQQVGTSVQSRWLLDAGAQTSVNLVGWEGKQKERIAVGVQPAVSTEQSGLLFGAVAQVGVNPECWAEKRGGKNDVVGQTVRSLAQNGWPLGAGANLEGCTQAQPSRSLMQSSQLFPVHAQNGPTTKFNDPTSTLNSPISIVNSSTSPLNSSTSTLNEAAAYALIKRIIPKHAHHFTIASIPQENNKDVFELESVNGKIVLRGNNGVSVASALNYFLKNFAHCDISWNGTNLAIPEPFPKVPQRIRKQTPHTYRHYFNYCTFNYTASWWDWKRWEWEIDFMALNGINMPLAMTGQNALWDRVYRSMGFGDKDMDAFFTGPAYFMWFWAGNIDGLNGPLPQSWMKSHEALQEKILARERELGMKPILPAFSGHVPPTFKEKYPNAKVDRVSWEGRFADAYVLDPDDPLFQEIGDRFMEEQNKTYGTDHLYGADTFNEMHLPHQDSAYVRKIGRAVYQAMAKKDPKAIWVMQAWLFWDKRDFWKKDRIQNYLSDIPDANIVLLDLFAEEQPIWVKTNSFFGKPWIWCMLHNFGGRNPLYGNLAYLAKEPAEMVHDPNRGRLTGIGLVPEGIEQNPVVYSLMLHHVWDNQPVQLDEWLMNYAHSRYGQRNPHTEEAWKILKRTVYVNEGNYDPITNARPTFNKEGEWIPTHVPYDPAELIKAWDQFILPARSLGKNDCYQFDLVTVSRQVLANYSNMLQQQFAAAYKKK